MYLGNRESSGKHRRGPQTLPPGKLELAADYIERLKRISEEERQAVLARTFGSLSREDADAMEKAIEEGCERLA